MKKISAVIISLGILIGLCSWASVNAKADGVNTLKPTGNEAIKDEGYGNADAEYYGSKDDLVNDDSVNDDQSTDAQANTLRNAQK